MREHIRNDGNGGYYVSKRVVNGISVGLILLFATALIPTVLAYGELNYKVDNLVDKTTATRVELEDFEVRLRTSETCNQVNKIYLKEISQSILEIKKDIRELREEVRNTST